MVQQKKIFLTAVMAAWMVGTPTLQAASQEQLVQSIMKLRSDVEALYTQINENRENYKAQMKSYTMQRADMEAQINRQETALKLIKADIEKAQQKLAALQQGNEDITPVLYRAIDRLDAVIAHGIPFKVQERREELKKIKAHLADKSLKPEKGLAMVWASYDDMIRLTKEIGLFKQPIQIAGREKLAKIAKLGSVSLYFATPDDEVGYVTRKGSGYDYKVVHDEKERAQIVALFDALQKQIRTGYFTLPNALVLEETK